MTLIDADTFLQYLIFSKHIDSLKCKEVKEAIEMSKVDVFDKIRTEIEHIEVSGRVDEHTLFCRSAEQIKHMALDIIDKYRKEEN